VRKPNYIATKNREGVLEFYSKGVLVCYQKPRDEKHEARLVKRWQDDAG